MCSCMRACMCECLCLCVSHSCVLGPDVADDIRKRLFLNSPANSLVHSSLLSELSLFCAALLVHTNCFSHIVS